MEAINRCEEVTSAERLVRDIQIDDKEKSLILTLREIPLEYVNNGRYVKEDFDNKVEVGKAPFM